jgi:hypothetical protein
MQMKDEELNLAVATACGWNYEPPKGGFAPWSTDIGRAMELLDQLEETERPFTLTDSYEGWTRNGFICTLGDIRAQASTAARAICLAFLALKNSPAVTPVSPTP